MSIAQTDTRKLSPANSLAGVALVIVNTVRTLHSTWRSAQITATKHDRRQSVTGEI